MNIIKTLKTAKFKEPQTIINQKTKKKKLPKINIPKYLSSIFQKGLLSKSSIKRTYIAENQSLLIHQAVVPTILHVYQHNRNMFGHEEPSGAWPDNG